jgi:hypothetical protein
MASVAAPPFDAMTRFRALLELYELSEALVRQNLRRRRPEATDADIETAVRRWLVKADEPDQMPVTVVQHFQS